MTHTPGPWHLGEKFVGEADGYLFAGYPISAMGQAIARVWAGRAEGLGMGNEEANARLIAAAPELLAALQQISTHGNKAADIAIAAIKKATEANP